MNKLDQLLWRRSVCSRAGSFSIWGLRRWRAACASPPGPLQLQRGRGIHLLYSSCRVAHALEVHTLKGDQLHQTGLTNGRCCEIHYPLSQHGLKGARHCFHMKVASQQNHGKPLPILWPGWIWAVWSLYRCTTKHKQGFEWFICPAHGLTEAKTWPQSHSIGVIFHFLRSVWAALKWHRAVKIIDFWPSVTCILIQLC